MPSARSTLPALLTILWTPVAFAGPSFVNWESPHVHPIDITPDGTRLLAVNTPDNRLEVFDISRGVLSRLASAPVGLDPVSVRALSNHEAWVVNHISDTVSIVDLDTMHVVATMPTLDEPADVVFAGEPQRAFVSCSQANTIMVFDPADLTRPAAQVPIDAEEPKSLAVSLDGRLVYAAVFESGNATTILSISAVGNLGGGGGRHGGQDGPYGGLNPPPNDGVLFRPPQNPNNPAPPAVALIVRKNDAGRWMDDNIGDWTERVSGDLSQLSGRPRGWDLLDRDIAVVDTDSLEVEYVTGLMNLCMAISVVPGSGGIAVVGTDAKNQIRYEPNLNGRFLRVLFAGVDPDDFGEPTIVDLNPHLVYTDTIPFEPIPQADRDKSLGDPRAILWNSAGTRGYVCGMGSNNVVVVDATGKRLAPLGDPTAFAIETGEGPTGLALDESRNRLYVLNKFGASITTIDTATEQPIGEESMFDPSPSAIKVGRKHLYDTHTTSGLGHVSCASCHVDAITDRLAWDLGDPSGEMASFEQNCFMGLIEGCPDYHPMKGPMVTQTLRDIIGKEPFHRRGDRDGIEAFNGAFMTLLGDDELLSPEEMDELKSFLATIHFPPNPFRNFDNSLPESMPLPGHFSAGRFGPAGEPMPDGNAQTGLQLFRTPELDAEFKCVTCHTLPTGTGTNLFFDGRDFVPFPLGPNGEMHHALVDGGGSSGRRMKMTELRSAYEKVGFDTTQTLNRAGFGYFHDGTVDSLVRFNSVLLFDVTSRQEVSDLVAFTLAFSGSDLPMGTFDDPDELIGPTSKDAHAAVGAQITCNGSNNNDIELLARLDQMASLAEKGAIGLIAKARPDGAPRGYVYVGGGQMQSDRAAEYVSLDALRVSAAKGSEITFTVVPAGTQFRIGVDRDDDGYYDLDEVDACSDPADAFSTPANVSVIGDYNLDGIVDLADHASFAECRTWPSTTADRECRCAFDFNRDDDVDLGDFAEFVLSVEDS